MLYAGAMKPITVSVRIAAPVDTVWEQYIETEHVMRWNHASDEWHCPDAENDLRVGGTFRYRMEAKDGSDGFDFSGTYTEVIPHERIAYRMDDGRMALVAFIEEGEMTTVAVAFDPEDENSRELQRQGWQAILESFKRECEAQRQES